MPTASQSQSRQVAHRRRNTLKASSSSSSSSPVFKNRRVSLVPKFRNVFDSDSDAAYRYEVTKTSITEVKLAITTDGKDKILSQVPNSITNVTVEKVSIKRHHSTDSPNNGRHNPKVRHTNYKSDDNNSIVPYSYNNGISQNTDRSSNTVSVIGVPDGIVSDLHANTDKTFMAKSKISSVASIPPVDTALASKQSLPNGEAKRTAKVATKISSGASALELRENKTSVKVSDYFTTNFNKARSHLKTDAMGMASMQLKMPTKDIWKCLIAELIGTCLLIVIGCGSVLTLNEPKELDLTGKGLCWGFTVATLAQTLGNISGCHINPAVTLAMMVTGKIQLIKAGLYIVVQCIGALLGAAVLKALTPDEIKGLWGITTLGPGVTPIQGFGIEFLATFVLLLTIFGVSDENRTDVKGSAPLAIGLCITALVLFCGPFTGCSLNPARTLGPSVVAANWDNHWLYWIGPISGAVTAAVLYQQVLRALSPEEIAAVQAEQDTKKRDTDTKEGSMPNV